MHIKHLAGVVAGFCASLLAVTAFAQPIPTPVPASITAYFEQECRAELDAMQATLAVGMNGVAHSYFYETIYAMNADQVRARFAEYDGAGGGFRTRRGDTAFLQASIVWEDCLMNARLRQLGAPPVARAPLPPLPAPVDPQPVTPPPDDPALTSGEDAEQIAGPNGKLRWVMKSNGRDCVIVQAGQQRGTQAGAFEQTVTIKNRCNVQIPVTFCSLEGECADFTVPPNVSMTEVVGTSQGLRTDWQLIKFEDLDDSQVPPQPDGGNDYSGGGSRGGSGGGQDGGSGADSAIDFGDDSGQWARDGECDDPRFSGAGMAAADTLTEDNYFRDASDCRDAMNNGGVEFVGYVELPNQDNGRDERDEGGDFWGTFLDTINTGLDVYNALHNNDGGGGSADDGDYGGGDGGFEEEENDACGCIDGVCACQ